MLNIRDYPYPVHVIGVGGIGTHVVRNLLDMGVSRLVLWDDDKVESRNIPTQSLYRRKDVGTPKVEAAKLYIQRQTDSVAIQTHTERVTSETALKGIVISCVDNIDERRTIWGALKNNPFVPLYMDGRIGEDAFQLHSLNPSNPQSALNYQLWLTRRSAVVPDLSCITLEPYCAQNVATQICINLTLFFKDKPLREYLRREIVTESIGMTSTENVQQELYIPNKERSVS